MRAVVQRVSAARVRVGENITGQIEEGLLVYLGVEVDDGDIDLDYILDKVTNLRIFEDQYGKMNLSVRDVGGAILAVSQFTLYGDCRKGRRPSFTYAAGPEKGEDFYNQFIHRTREMGIRIETGIFRAHMHVESVNDGPVTILLDSRRDF